MTSPAAPSVCVVIPVYKPTLTPYEEIALTQCQRVLGHYVRALVHPAGLDVSSLAARLPGHRTVAFTDTFFSGIQGYNRLMLSEAFYAAFAEFDYVLIYQLDAFVFSDQLAYWCQQGYDYIGAPWLYFREFRHRREAALFALKKRVARWIRMKNVDGVTPRDIIRFNSVGNGGLSLRRVASLQHWSRTLQHEAEAYSRQEAHQFNEDVFWSIEVNRYWPRLRIPDYRTALRFSIENFPERAISVYNGGHLPFGCHAWDVHETAYWRPIFAQHGYQI